MIPHKLEVRNVSMAFGNERILEDISIHVDEGELISLLGVSGSGKTTLFHCIAGLYRPVSGSILLDGESITGRAGRVSYMLQKDLMLPHYTMEDNVALPLLIRGKKRKEARAEVQRYFPQFGLEGTQKKYPRQMSGGMRQRAALLRTYLFSDNLALLDEPFSALDTITKSAVHDWYLEVMQEIRLSTLFITHDIDEAILLSDRVYILTGKPGHIRDEIVIRTPRSERAQFALSEEFLAYKREIVACLYADHSGTGMI